MAILEVKATKISASDKLGFNYTVTDEQPRPVVTNVNSFGLFGNSGLEVGHEILLINGEIPTKSNIRDVLSSLGSGEVSLVVERSSSSLSNNDESCYFELLDSIEKRRFGDKHIMCTAVKAKMACSTSTPPPILQQIKQSDWLEIFYTVAAKLQPETINCANVYYDMKMRINGEFMGYLGHDDVQRNCHDQIQKNEMVKLNVTLHNCLVVAQCVLGKVNGILSKYNITAGLLYKSLERYTVNQRWHYGKELMIDGLNLPTGIHFCAAL